MMQPLQQAVPGAVTALLRQGDLSPGKVEFAWSAAVGPAIAGATKVTLEPGGTLVVRVTSVHWRQAIERATSTILGRLGQYLGEGVIVKVTPIGGSAGAAARGKSARPRTGKPRK
jgi:hypothetical protein